MPKEIRQSSHSYRHDPRRRSPDVPSSHRATSIWTAEDDDILMTARAQGLNWQPIADAHFPHKSGNACRKRHERLMEKRNAQDWDIQKLERLAVAYMAVRKEMWGLLAAQINERWPNVEAKCMEKGIKNIAALYKSAVRNKDRDDRENRGGMPPHYLTPQSLYPSPDCGRQERDYADSETDAECELDYAPPALPPQVAATIASGESSGYVSASSAYLQHRPTHMYQPIAIQPAMYPAQAMMLRAQGMQPMPQGRSMSIHSMLSPSPPGDSEDDE